MSSEGQMSINDSCRINSVISFASFVVIYFVSFIVATSYQLSAISYQLSATRNDARRANDVRSTNDARSANIARRANDA